MRDEDRAWHARLSQGGRLPRTLASHLACRARLAHCPDQPGAMLQGMNAERLFLHTMQSDLLQKRDTCGLPSPLPPFIALLNLSGETFLAFTQCNSVVRALCGKSSALRSSELEQQVARFCTYPTAPLPKSDDEARTCQRFVLLVYSLPWQGGLGSEHWSLNACSVSQSADGVQTLHDRLMVMTSASLEAFGGRPVLDAAESTIHTRTSIAPLSLVTDRQLKEFRESYQSVSLDVDATFSASLPGPVVANDDGTGGTNSPGTAGLRAATTAAAPLDAKPASDGCGYTAGYGATRGDGSGNGPGSAGPNLREAQLKSIIEALQQARKKDHAEIASLKVAVAEQVRTNVEVAKCASQQKAELIAKHEAQLASEDTKTQKLLSLTTKTRDSLQLELDSQLDANRRLATENSREVARASRLKEKHEALLKQTSLRESLAQSKLANAATVERELREQLESHEERHESFVCEVERHHAQSLDSLKRSSEKALAAARVVVSAKERIINQLSEHQERVESELSSATLHIADQDERLAQAERAVRAQDDAPRAVATMTTASTATHACASTQTPSAPAPAPAPVVSSLDLASRSYQHGVQNASTLLMAAQIGLQNLGHFAQRLEFQQSQQSQSEFYNGCHPYAPY